VVQHIHLITQKKEYNSLSCFTGLFYISQY